MYLIIDYKFSVSSLEIQQAPYQTIQKMTGRSLDPAHAPKTIGVVTYEEEGAYSKGDNLMTALVQEDGNLGERTRG